MYLNFGYEYGVTTQLGCARKINASLPLLLTLDYSTPKGKDVFDDFKVRIGAQAPLYTHGNFNFTAKVYGNFRRHQTRFVRMASFGSEITGLIGYYKSSWHFAGEFGFDKSITTHFATYR